MLSPILDGYTITATISVPPWSPITFVYRPALPEKVFDYTGAARTTAKEKMAAAVKLLTGNLQSWDIGETVACSEENWRKLPFPILDKIIDHVIGFAAPETADPK